MSDSQLGTANQTQPPKGNTVYDHEIQNDLGPTPVMSGTVGPTSQDTERYDVAQPQPDETRRQADNDQPWRNGDERKQTGFVFDGCKEEVHALLDAINWDGTPTTYIANQSSDSLCLGFTNWDAVCGFVSDVGPYYEITVRTVQDRGAVNGAAIVAFVNILNRDIAAITEFLKTGAYATPKSIAEKAEVLQRLLAEQPHGPLENRGGSSPYMILSFANPHYAYPLPPQLRPVSRWPRFPRGRPESTVAK